MNAWPFWMMTRRRSSWRAPPTWEWSPTSRVADGPILSASKPFRSCGSIPALPTSVTIGAALTLNEVGERWTDAPDAFREWLSLFASPLIRNRATIGGNLATASPVGDAAPLLLALDATVHVAGLSGRRSMALSSFFTGYRKTALAAGEIITAVEIPKPLPETLRFYKVAKRRLDDISTVAAALALDFGPHGVVRRARFAFGGVAATPISVARGRSRRCEPGLERCSGRACPGNCGTKSDTDV